LRFLLNGLVRLSEIASSAWKPAKTVSETISAPPAMTAPHKPLLINSAPRIMALAPEAQAVATVNTGPERPNLRAINSAANDAL